MKKIITAVFALALCGCVTVGQLRDGLHALIGKPLSVAVDKLGLPTSETSVAGMHLVKWSAVSGNEFQCTITLQIDENSIIQKTASDGNLGGCERYIKALNK